jgi:hypothetical protein
MNRPRFAQDGRKISGDLCDVGTTPMPQRLLRGRNSEAQHLLDATVAIGRHDQHGPRQPIGWIYAEEEVVMKLASLPVIENLVAAEAGLEVRQ